MKRSALITGTSSGIGKQIAKLLLQKNFAVYGLCRKAAHVFSTEENYYPIPFDLTQSMKKLDIYPIDILICNAGIGLLGKLEQLSPSEIEETIMVNFTSHVLLVKKYISHLKTQKRADIIFIGSEAAFQGKKEGSIYCATKFALRGFCQALREECGKTSVKVSIIHPCLVDTAFYNNLSIIPKNALLAEDIACMVDYVLQSPDRIIFDEILMKPKTYRVIKKNTLGV